MSDQESPGRHENGSGRGSYVREDGSPRGSPRRERKRSSRSGSRSENNRNRKFTRSSREREVDDFRPERTRRSSRDDGSRSGRNVQPDREHPPSGRCLGVFGLSIYTQETDLKEILGKYGPIEDTQIVYDAQTGRSRGFAFVYFEHERDAAAAKERCNGIEVDGRKIRVDFSITQRAHTPTPGIYMGKPTRRREGRPMGGSGHRPGGDRPREREDYRPSSYSDYPRREEYRPPPPREFYPDPYSSSSRAPPPLPPRGYDDRYAGGRDNGYSHRRSPSPPYPRSAGGSRYRERSRSYSPRKYRHY